MQNSQSDSANSWTNAYRLKQTQKAKFHFKAVPDDQFSIQQSVELVEYKWAEHRSQGSNFAYFYIWDSAPG